MKYITHNTNDINLDHTHLQGHVDAGYSLLCKLFGQPFSLEGYKTDAEWRATKSFVEEIGFAHMHIFTYSPRQGTKAAQLPGHVDKEGKRRRSRQLHALGAQMRALHLARFRGTTRPVLWESDPESLADGRSRWRKTIPS